MATSKKPAGAAEAPKVIPKTASKEKVEPAAKKAAPPARKKK